MPFYEFICNQCKKRFEVQLSYADYGKATPSCSHCGSGEVRRKIGRIRVKRAGGIDMGGEGGFQGMPAGLENDPISMGRMMRQMASETGEAMPEEVNEMVSRLERGESPDQIEKSMPDLGNDSGYSDSLD